MTTLSSDVSAALASLRTRWGEAAPRVGGEALGGTVAVVGALATVPLPDEPARPSRTAGRRRRRVVRTGFAALDAILGPGGVPRTALRRSGATPRAARPPSPFGSRPRPRPPARSSPMSIWPASLDPVEAVARGVRLEWLVVLEPTSLDEALAMAGALLQGRAVDLLIVDLPSAGDPDRSPGSPGQVARLMAGGRPRADRLGRLAALAREPRSSSSCSSRRVCPAISSAIGEAVGLRLELAQRAWIRLGRDVVGQRTEVVVARNRSGPPGRRAELRILYAEGGGATPASAARPPPHRCPHPSSSHPADHPTDATAPSLWPHLPLRLARERARPTRAPDRSRPGRSSSAGSPGRTGPSST